MGSNNGFSQLILVCLIGLLCAQCASEKARLPYIGNMEVKGTDTIYHTIPDFVFVDQDRQTITNGTFDGQVYIADFFFTACPSICPKVKKNMLRIYDKYGANPNFKMVSHSIDVQRDTVEHLKMYAENLGIDTEKWHLLTGDKDHIFEMADTYFVSALEDPNAPGGFDHSGRIILVDTDRRVRSYCDGTDAQEVDRFMQDIKQLLDAEFGD